jgi:hypothetical protein
MNYLKDVIMKLLYIILVVILFPFFGYSQAFFENRTSDMPQERFPEARIINAFPNPVQNNLTIVLNYLPVRRFTVEIIDFNGRLRRSFAFAPGGQQISMDLSFLDPGDYVVRVLQSGRLVDRTRILKSVD